MNTSPFRFRLMALLVIGLASTALMGAFFPFNLATWQGVYPSSQSDDNVDLGTGAACQLCHEGSMGGDPWNAYGWEVREEFMSTFDLALAIVNVEPLDSDGDGSSNVDEINGDTQPGWTPGPNNTVYFKNGEVAAATTSIQTKGQVKEILDSTFGRPAEKAA